MDETFEQLTGGVREPPPPAPGRAERYDSVCTRHGVASLFLAFEPLAGWREVRATDTRERTDWARFIRDSVDGRYRDADTVVLVMDQLNAHSVGRLHEAFPPAEAWRTARRLEVHRTPKHGSWLNTAEIGLSASARDLPERVGDRVALARPVAAWKARRNGAGARADWQFTTADARVKLRKLYPTIDGWQSTRARFAGV